MGYIGGSGSVVVVRTNALRAKNQYVGTPRTTIDPDPPS